MNMDAMQGDELDFSYVRDQLDEILANEITALLDVDATSAMMSINLASISCVTLIIEREREIKLYSEHPPERYTLESFTNELVDIGLERDETLEKTIQSVLKNGYISVDENGELRAEMPAFIMVGFLDNMFPGMQGMNLIAFVLQMNDEVNTGRKTLQMAKKSFEASLKSRGVIVSKDIAEKKASEIVSGKASISTQSREIARKLKKDNMDRLSQIIRKRKKRTSEFQEQVKITDVFDKGPTKEELAIQKAEIKRAEEAAQLAKRLAEKEERIKEAEEAAKEAARQLEEIEEREKQLLAAEQEAQKARERAAELEAREAMMAQKEAELKALEERLRIEAEEKEAREKREMERQAKELQEQKASQSDDDIESRIAAFENNLTMPCPLCREGEIVSRTTEKGKTFYSCTRDECRFVSWDKPYHFECPLCKNPFLTETAMPTGETGLKCPRASCTYRQNSLVDPQQNMAMAAAAAAPKKKKKIVRRKKRR